MDAWLSPSRDATVPFYFGRTTPSDSVIPAQAGIQTTYEIKLCLVCEQAARTLATRGLPEKRGFLPCPRCLDPCLLGAAFGRNQNR